jgi:hypothetical protein
VLGIKTTQAQICYDLSSEQGLQITVEIIAARSYSNLPDNLFTTGEFTLSWDQSLGNDVIQGIDSPSNMAFTYTPLGGPAPTLSGGRYYQKFGFAQPSVQTLTANTPVTILQIDVISSQAASGSFEIIPTPPDDVVGGDSSLSNAFGEQYDNHGCDLLVGNVILPLDFLSFYANVCNESACLTWTTANEEGVSHFNILRLNGTQWINIGKEKATNKPNASYIFKDKNVLPGQTYIYQIVGIDYDGSETISEKRSVTFSGQSPLNVYPNPCTAAVTLTVPQDVSLKIYNSQGITQFNFNMGSSSTITLDCSSWPAGSYSVVAYDQSGLIVGETRFIKQ